MPSRLAGDGLADAPERRPLVTEVPALDIKGVWKLYGAARDVRAAARSIAGGAEAVLPDRAAIESEHDVFAALAGVSLRVRRRETLAVVGLSGSGKSTLVRHLNGLLTPTCGEVRVDGRDISTLRASALQALRSTHVGMVFQSTSLFPHRTVLQNVIFGLEVRGVPRRDMEATARLWLDRVELSDWADRYPDELSGGMQQRVGLARTLATDPEILLLDEPFSALDPLIRRSLQDEFVSLVARYRKTAVFITHDFAEAVRIADRIAVMSDGKIVQVGTPREVLFTPATDYVASFGTREMKARFTQAADIATATPSRPACGTHTIPGDTPVAEIIRMASGEDVSFEVMDKDGSTTGWIDRSVLLSCLEVIFDDPPARPNMTL
ncbi:ATP-binding cassette domain-containing protein [Acuticoccus sp. MNP-M23]|uniref:ATP-binding cassette domain-containing protein n=1 Tax=Acuticoccus sp. MNP-M23 TaxID=3072793 RepID=UPI0028167DC0|nr:ATP-binding cassette domain-containing protein [Acuticoccus sp. MNP-M23]WMS41329.1 ATP-binding cassette domain-containing protein [Acuticoccus sp. MNP-M23]